MKKETLFKTVLTVLCLAIAAMSTPAPVNAASMTLHLRELPACHDLSVRADGEVGKGSGKEDQRQGKGPDLPRRDPASREEYL